MSEVPEYATEEKQIARSKLREGFLRQMMAFQGKCCTVTTHEKTKINAIFKGFDVDFQEMLLDDLETPSGIVPHAIMRANDIFSIDFIENDENT